MIMFYIQLTIIFMDLEHLRPLQNNINHLFGGAAEYG